MSIKLTGKSFIGSSRGGTSEKTFSAFDPRSGNAVDPVFSGATNTEFCLALELAEEARKRYAKVSGTEKARFLRQIAINIESLGDDLIVRASLETGLPETRFMGERARTCFQLRLFADLVEEGSWVDARIDFGNPHRQPLPMPDIRSMLRPIGPVVIFCAGNFPLAFSVAGGDTVSALAAGCPVIVNAHSAHPGTSELVGMAIADAITSCRLPDGVFSLLFSNDYAIGQKLVKHPTIKAVGFTGSRSGGLALIKIAGERSEPIPVFAEMSSINPVFILPNALSERGNEIAVGLHNSFTLGVGQFCTKPGLVILSESRNLEPLKLKLEELTSGYSAAPLLTNGIKNAFQAGVAERGRQASEITGESELEGYAVNSAFFQTNADNFLKNPDLSREIFGPTTLLVVCPGREQLLEIARNLEGQLTATIHGTPEDLLEFADLVEILDTKAGRIIFNGYPTGVEVCHAMVHGGGFPATSDSRSTSVGTRAINRFARLVCYQDFPQENLPDELKNENPLEVWRMVDGQFSR